MPVEQHDPFSDASDGAASMVARAGRAAVRDELRLAVAIDDFFLPEEDRLDDRVRAAIGGLIVGIAGAIESEMTAYVARSVAVVASGSVLPRLIESGLLRDRTLMAELGGIARQSLLADKLALTIARSEQSGLLAKLAECPDGVVASAARDLLIAESRRLSGAGRADLPQALHGRMVWWIAAALRERNSGGAGFDRALAEAATRSLAAQDDGDRLEAAAMRLAAAIDAQHSELGELLVDSLSDARPALFVAGLAHAAAIEFPEARAIAFDPDGDRLWLVLRAQGLDRPTIAKIGLMLAEADRRRDLEAFADSLDAIVAIESDVATESLAPMRLHPDFRAAMRALSRSKPE